jgi:hypothetical protein
MFRAARHRHVLRGGEISLADQRRMRGSLEMTQPRGRVPPLHLAMPGRRAGRVGQDRSDGCRFRTCRPVYQGLARIAATVGSGFQAVPAAGGHGTPDAHGPVNNRAAALDRLDRGPFLEA